ncbi:hypothetical protein QBC40DRAFT_65296 [Triangularia verruculosa]|uniref:Uncharacterized protein n=1 Tax=Triangularia verruculosa TaxID=2587418 RepID=A0AAN6XSP7_9PEZI|nr:hypothetical protein QBC40DRAFT_65296 [Triangularia verruculosa]
MSSDNLNFQCALITGGGGGIGKALASYFISKGKKVIIAGRTESNIEATAKEIGAADYYVLDTGKTATFPEFVSLITQKHPELDCLVNNAGVQKSLEVSKLDPSEFIYKADEEININIRGPMHLTLQLLPHFRLKPAAMIVNVSSVLGFVPFSVINPVYNGTKAWLHFWSLNLRTQLRDEPLAKIKVVEIAPPMVGTDLHCDREDPDDNKKEKNPISLSLEEFMEEVAEKMERGEEMITAGPMGREIVGAWYQSDGLGGRYKKAEEGKM